MAGVGFAVVTPEQATGTVVRTVLQVLAVANHALLIREWSVSFEGINTTGTPILVELLRQTTAGTGGTSNPPVKWPNDDSDETLQVTALRAIVTTEPTAGDVLDAVEVHPQTGYTWQAPFGQWIKVGGGDRLGIRVTADASINCVATMKGEE